MSIAIAHLGDIHIESQTDPVFDRIGQLGALIASEVENSASHLFVLVNGDWTNRGQAKEFKAAKEFVTSLRDELARRASPTPIILGTPGNHDCELVDDQAARDAVIASHADASVPPESITRIAVEPLQRCFSFLQEIGSSHLTGADPYVASLEHEVDGRKVAFTLINSAWMSMRKERPGTLHFPVSLLTELPEVAADLSIT
ncbi:MAG: metallophosphoesterase family protein, partial [Planctomycetota bacterium]